jgi:hypothetical protein
MNRTLSNLGPALLMALLVLIASALAVAAPRASWAAFAGPILLALGLVGIDLVQRRRWLPSPGALLVAAAILVACGIVAPDLNRLAGLIPILGGCAAVPVILRHEGARPSCG